MYMQGGMQVHEPLGEHHGGPCIVESTKYKRPHPEARTPSSDSQNSAIPNWWDPPNPPQLRHPKLVEHGPSYIPLGPSVLQLSRPSPGFGDFALSPLG